MEPQNLHRNHRLRMRQSFIRNGCKGLYPHQLLEMLLFYTIPRSDTNPAAHRLLQKFGSLENVLNASAAELEQVDGIGPVSACFITAAAEFCRRYSLRSETDQELSSADDLKNYLSTNFPGFPDDRLLVISISSRLELIHCENVRLDVLTGNTFTARYIAEIILKSGSERIAAGIFHTNQPAVPSPNDYYLTKIIAETAQILGTELLDMVIYNKSSAFSMRESGSFGFSQV